MAETKYTDNVVIEGSDETKVQLAVQGDTSQEKALQTWEDDIDTRLAQVSKEGYVQVGDDLDDALANALIEAQRDEDSTAKPKRGLNLIGRIKDTLNTTVSWVAQELQLVGSSGVDAQHTAVRGRLNNDNTGAMTANAELRGGDFEVTNKAADATPREGTAIGVRAAVTNQSSGYIKDMMGVQIELNNENTATDPIDNTYGLKIEDVEDATNNYALYTGAGQVHIGDVTEFEKRIQVTGNAYPATGTGVEIGHNGTDGVLLSYKRDTPAEFKNMRYNALSHEFDISAANAMIIDSNGNVGIGTNNPSQKLEIVDGSLNVRQTVSDAAAFIGAQANGGDNYLRLEDTSNGVIWQLVHDAYQGGNDLKISHLDSGSTWSTPILIEHSAPSDSIHIDSDGKVGIGTPSPEGQLHVYTGHASASPDVNADEFVIEGSGNTGMSILAGSISSIYMGYSGDALSAALQYSATENLLKLGTHRASGELQFKTGNWVDAMRIDASGNVGIGTTSPETILDVHKSGNTRIQHHDTKSTIVTGSNNGGSLYFGGDITTSNTTPASAIETSWGGATNPQIGIGVIRDGLKTNILMDYARNIYFRDGSTVRMRINSSGNVGIGTSSPGNLLHVEANAEGDARHLINVKNTSTTGGAVAMVRVRDADDEYIRIKKHNSTYTGVTGYAGYAQIDTNSDEGLLLSAIDPTGVVRILTGGSSLSSNTRIFVDSDGDVGIGDTTPSEKLDVNGNVRADDYIEYSPLYVGDALTAIQQIAAETRADAQSDWAEVDHDTLPEKVRVVVSERIWRNPNTGEELPKNSTPDEHDNPEDWELVDRDVAGRSLSASVQLNLRGIQQLIDRIENLEAAIAS